jgi:hypothetical protein
LNELSHGNNKLDELAQSSLHDEGDERRPLTKSLLPYQAQRISQEYLFMDGDICFSTEADDYKNDFKDDISNTSSTRLSMSL